MCTNLVTWAMSPSYFEQAEIQRCTYLYNEQYCIAAIVQMYKLSLENNWWANEKRHTRIWVLIKRKTKIGKLIKIDAIK